MNFKRALGLLLCGVLAVSCFAQGVRGKAELKAGAGVITVDYGRPALKGRDMLSQLKDGDFWRMGSNQATTLNAPVDLAFGATKISKGAYSLWLQRSGDKFDLVFNSQTGQWGTMHDKSKDMAKASMKQENLPSPVESFTIELKAAPKGGVLLLTWGTTALSADFQFAQ